MATNVNWPVELGRLQDGEYDSYAEVYASGIGARSIDLDFYLDLARRTLPVGGEVLELGVGNGRVSAPLLDAGFRVVGVDANARMLEVAQKSLARHGSRFETVQADARAFNMGRSFKLVIAPFGMMAHLLTDEDRLAAMRSIFAHLEPGGLFVFDDAPAWLTGPSDPTALEIRHEHTDPTTGQRVRLMTMSAEVAGQPLSLAYHFIDWLDGDLLVRRSVQRLVFRNATLEEELRMLGQAGFAPIEALGGFDGRAFQATELAKNERLILRCHRPAR